LPDTGAGVVCGALPPPLEQADANPRSSALLNRRRDENDDMREVLAGVVAERGVVTEPDVFLLNVRRSA
jgi:hypothetical protein